jgi:hypothetical protein
MRRAAGEAAADDELLKRLAFVPGVFFWVRIVGREAMTDRERLIENLRAWPVTVNPPGWRQVTVAAVGGLSAVGFSASGEGLLVVSTSGLGVFDGASGERVARDADAPGKIDRGSLTAEGIGPLAGERVRVAGIHGGGLHRTTADGWRVEIAYPDWPDAEILLMARGVSFDEPTGGAGCFKIAHSEPPVACGFSPDGRFLVLAESHTLRWWARAG